MKADLNRKHQLSGLVRAIQPLILRVVCFISVLKKGKFSLKSKKYGFTKMVVKTFKERILEDWRKENLRVFQDAFEFIKRKKLKNLYNSAQNPAEFSNLPV